MPKLAGFLFVKSVRSIARNAATPIIMITPEAAKCNVVEAINAGVTNYVVIDVDLVEFPVGRLARQEPIKAGPVPIAVLGRLVLDAVPVDVVRDHVGFERGKARFHLLPRAAREGYQSKDERNRERAHGGTSTQENATSGARRRNRARVLDSGRSIAVIDNDPTGTQIVYGTRVCLDAEPSSLEAALRDPEPLFF